MLKGFRDFIMRGNVIDLAVAVVIGAAFTALVSSFSKALIEPIIIRFTPSQSGSWTVFGIEFQIGLLINAIITFLITAAVVYFIFVVPMNKLRDKFTKTKEDDPHVAEEIQLLREIRDELRARSGS